MDLRIVILFLAVIPFWGWLTGWSLSACIQRIASFKARMFFLVLAIVAVRMFFWALKLHDGPESWFWIANTAALLYGFINGPH